MSIQNKYRKWSSRSIATSFQHNIFYMLIRIAGRRAAYCLLYFVAFYYTLKPSIREKARYYLEKRFPNREGFKRFWDSYRLNLEFGKTLVDRAVLGILGEISIEASPQDKKTVLNLINEGQGLIILTAHVGCWQLAMSALDFINVPISVVYHRENGDVDLQYFEHSNKSCPFKFIDPSSPLGGTLEMLEVLKKGHVLCVMGDRVLGSDKNTVEVEFLGTKARFPFSAFKLASVLGSPIVVLFACKIGPSSGKIRLVKVIRVAKNIGKKREEYLPYVKQFVNSLEEITTEYPYQFFNFYDMWE